MPKPGLIARLMMPLVVMVALVAAVLLLGHHANRRVLTAAAALADEQDHALQLSELRSVSRSLQRDALNLVTEPSGAERHEIGQRFDRRVRKFESDLASLRRDTRLENPAEFARYQQTQRIVITNLLAVRRAAEVSRDDALVAFRRQVRPNERLASVIADELIDRSAALRRRLSAQAVEVEGRQVAELFVASVLLSLVAVVGALLLIVLTIVRPLRAIGQAMETLAAGDASIRIPHVEREDAIGRMARAIEVFRLSAQERDTLRAARTAERDAATERERAATDARLRETARLAQNEALEVQRRELLQSLAAAVDESLMSVNEKLRASAARLSHSADSVARHAAETGTEAEHTMRSAAEVARELNATSAATHQVALSAVELHAKATMAIEAVRGAVERSRTAATRFAGLSTDAERVGAIMELIKAIAQKSQLLALNASIEAVRAGDFGRGFGVVANEMKSLAAQTGAAADRVESELAAIRTAANDGASAIEEIGEAALQIERNAELVVRSMQEQDHANGEIGRGVATAMSGVHSVGERMADLGRTALSTRQVAGALQTDAELLDQDARQVDGALRDLIARLRAA